MKKSAFIALFLMTLFSAGTIWGQSAMRSDETAAALTLAPPLDIDATQMDINGGQMVYDPNRQLLYVITYDQTAGQPAGITPFTAEGQPLPLIPIEAAIYDLALSADGNYLYLDHWDTSSIARLNLVTKTIDLEWPLGNVLGSEDPSCAHPAVADMLVAQEDPEVVVATVYGDNCDRGDRAIVAYDNGVPRPNMVNVLEFPEFGAILEVGPEPNVIFSHDPSLSVTQTLLISEEGLAVTQTVDDVIFADDLQYSDGKLFSDNGIVNDAVTFDRLGRYKDFNSTVPFVADTELDNIYFVERRWDDENYENREWLMVFDEETYRLRAEGLIPRDLVYHRNFRTDQIVQVGPRRFFINGTNGALFFLRLTILSHFAYVPMGTANHCGEAQDDFSDARFGWPVGPVTNGTAAFVDGEYSLKSNGNGMMMVGSPFCPREAYDVTVDVRWEGTPGEFYGIILPLNGDIIDNTAIYIVVNPEKQGWATTGVDPSTLAPGILDLLWTHSPAIRPGNGVNQIRVEYSQRQYRRLFINGIEVQNVGSSEYPLLTTLALLSFPSASNPNADARFDNFIQQDRALGPLMTYAAVTAINGR